jgi:cytoskeleton protein RodZ
VSTPNATVLADAPGSGLGLRLSFAQPAWVEVRDGRNQIIFAELSPAGSKREVVGQPPFSLVVGNATQVTVEYQGRMIELSQRSKGDVARLTVE